MRAELKRLHQRVGITTVYVTHDQVEAMTLADRVVVMSAGRVQQIGSPQDVYRRPANLFVAGFVGSPAMNLLRGQACGSLITAGELSFRREGVADGEIVVGIRPEVLVPGAADGAPALTLEVELVEPLGESALVHGTVAGSHAESGAEEEQAVLTAAGSRAAVTAIFPEAAQPEPGQRVPVAVAPERIYLFDAASTEAIY